MYDLLLLLLDLKILLLNHLYSLSGSYSHCLGLPSLLDLPVRKFCHFTALLLKHLYQRGLKHLIIGKLAGGVGVVSCRVSILRL